MRTYKGFTEDLKATYGNGISNTSLEKHTGKRKVKPEVQASMLQNISQTA